MSVQQQTTKKPKTLSPEQLERKRIKEQIDSHKNGIKELSERLAKMTPEKKPKSKIVMTETMRLAQTVGKSLHEQIKGEDGKMKPKKVASKAELRSACAKIVGLGNIDELTRSQVHTVASESLALLEVMPKPEKKPRAAKSN